MISEFLSLFLTINNIIFLVLNRRYVLTLRNEGFPFLHLWIKVTNSLIERNTCFVGYIFGS